MEKKLGIIGGGVMRGAAALIAGSRLVDPSGVPVATEPTPEEKIAKARHTLAVGRALLAGPLQVFDFGHGAYDEHGHKIDSDRVVVQPDPPKRVQDRAGRDYLFSGSKLLRARPKLAGGKKARRRAKARAVRP